MKFHKIFIFFILIFLVSSCSKKEEKISVIEQTNLEMQMIEAYNEGLKQLEEGEFRFAAKKFNEVELLYPQSAWAVRSTLMAAYSYYSDFYYNDAIIELERFLDKYENHHRRDYAYFLLAICHYDQIVDEKKDLGQIIEAEKYFKIILKDYPNTEFALDSEFKLEVINEILASKEIYLARYYLDREKWIPSMNRFKKIVKKYDETIFIEEAL